MPKSIMIVDDNAIMRSSLRTLLGGNANWVICAEAVDGHDALEQARRFHPDFVVLDLCMPNMDGLEAAPRLKAISPKSSILMLTAFKDTILEEKAYKAGISFVLAKDETAKILDFARILLRPQSPDANEDQSN
jgi:CheY-like chemotaxis protein